MVAAALVCGTGESGILLILCVLSDADNNWIQARLLLLLLLWLWVVLLLFQAYEACVLFLGSLQAAVLLDLLQPLSTAMKLQLSVFNALWLQCLLRSRTGLIHSTVDAV